jgi:hypothetical protein
MTGSPVQILQMINGEGVAQNTDRRQRGCRATDKVERSVRNGSARRTSERPSTSNDRTPRHG